MRLLKHSAFAFLIFFGCSHDTKSTTSNKRRHDTTQLTDSVDDQQNTNQPLPSEVVSAAELTSQFSFKIPSNQQLASQLPPQPGSKVFGKVVKGGPNQDTNWTAFSLVLFINQNQHIEILTQKRAISPVGTIETAGGHLTGGQTWQMGAQAEVFQETGITLKASDFILLSGAQPRVSKKGFLYGNANFFVALKDQKPATNTSCHEIDPKYGHKWVDLKALYAEVKAEQLTSQLKHGKYYSFFRTHVLEFCQKVLSWP